MPRPIVSSANTNWRGDLVSGSGNTTLATSGMGTFAVNWKSRAEEAGGTTSPEELLAAAHATCYSMQLSHFLAEAGHPATSLETQADVTFVAGEGVTGIKLTLQGDVPGIALDAFLELADKAKAECPISKALAGVDIALEATLV